MGHRIDPSCDDLRRRFIAAARDPTGTWWRVWTLFVEHACYQAILDETARRLIRKQHAPRDWLEDVKQDAILILARKLRRAMDLNFDPGRRNSRFTSWLRVVVRSHCQDALRGLYGRSARTSPLLFEPAAKPSAANQRIDLHVAMLRVNARERVALTLFAQGYTDREIAGQLDLTIGQARGLRLRGLRFLSLLLDGPASSSAP